MKLKLAFSLIVIGASCAGCMTQLYDGAKRDRNEVARITGDPVITAGSPITVVLRRVDEHDISIARTTVEVLEGEHELLVDCRLAGTLGQLLEKTADLICACISYLVSLPAGVPFATGP